MSEALKGLRKEKLKLFEALLEKLEAMEDALGLRNIILERQLMIDLLRSWSESDAIE